MSGLSRCRAAVGTIAAIALLALAHGGCSARSAPVVDPRTQNLHFQLLGVDWERVQKDRPGIAPLKVIGELDIPKPYIAAHRGLTGWQFFEPYYFLFCKQVLRTKQLLNLQSLRQLIAGQQKE